jgi:hypothetical protein
MEDRPAAEVLASLLEPARKRQKLRESLAEINTAEHCGRQALGTMAESQIRIVTLAQRTLLLLRALREAHGAALRSNYTESAAAAHKCLDGAGRRWLGWLQRNRLRVRMVMSHAARATLAYWAAVWATAVPSRMMQQCVEEHRQAVAQMWTSAKRLTRKRAIPVYEGDAEPEMSAAAAWRRRVRIKR